VRIKNTSRGFVAFVQNIKKGGKDVDVLYRVLSGSEGGGGMFFEPFLVCCVEEDRNFDGLFEGVLGGTN